MSNSAVVPVSPWLIRLRAISPVRGAHLPFVIEVCRELQPIAEDWRELERSGASTIFQRFDVFEAWTRTIAPGRADWLVVVVRRRSCGRVAMILPLAVRQCDGLKIIEGADLEVSDFLAPVVDADFRPSKDEMRAIWRQVLDVLPSADLICIDKMPGFIGDGSNPMMLLHGVERFHLSNFRTRLQWAGGYWTSRIPDKVRTDIAARRRKLGKRGKLAFRIAETEAEAERYFAVMLEQREERCRAMGRDNILAEKRYRDFYRSLLQPQMHDSPGVMQALLVDDTVVATGYGLRAASSFLMIFPTFAAQTWRNYSPGLQLFMESMTWAADQGMTWYDFTIGGEGFKRDLAAEAEPLYQYLCARSLKGAAAVARARLRARLRQSHHLRALLNRARLLRV